MILTQINWYRPHWKDPLYWVKIIIISVIARSFLLIFGLREAYDYYSYVFSKDTLYFAFAITIAELLTYWLFMEWKKMSK